MRMSCGSRPWRTPKSCWWTRLKPPSVSTVRAEPPPPDRASPLGEEYDQARDGEVAGLFTRRHCGGALAGGEGPGGLFQPGGADHGDLVVQLGLHGDPAAGAGVQAVDVGAVAAGGVLGAG